MDRQKYYPDKQAYWNEIESNRTDTLGLVSWAFDFISVHGPSHKDEYSLLSPLFLCDIKRPRFENRRFKTFEAALKYAERLAEKVSTRWKECHVVSCCDESLVAT